MTQPSKRFAWYDRDTAAHDMLQLATYAPPYIRSRALRLLRCFRSSKFLPELEAIVLDENEGVWERHYALCAIAEMPGDLYLPQFADVALLEHELFRAMTAFISRHPSNIRWGLPMTDCLPYQISFKALERVISASEKKSQLNCMACESILDLVKKYPLLLNTGLIQTLHTYGHPDVIQKWFAEYSKTIVYVCLLSQMRSLFDVLSDWDELRDLVFQNCASLKEEYNLMKRSRDGDDSREPDTRNYQLSEMWQSICLIYTSALRGDETAFKRLVQIASRSSEDMSEQGIAAYFLGELKDMYDVRTPLLHVLRAIYHPLHQDSHLKLAVQLEIEYVLCEVPSPDVWKVMIDIFLTFPNNFFEGNLPNWIAYLTDRLSGSEVDRRSEWFPRKSMEERMLRYTYEDMMTNNPFSRENLNAQRERERFQTRA